MIRRENAHKGSFGFERPFVSVHEYDLIDTSPTPDYFLPLLLCSSGAVRVGQDCCSTSTRTARM
ncbi:hypothetical protein KUH03_30990 [Sphingobacterium sp. E70]|uniref:hypothetical protein n=1 Tax=Sphingobacterium sp. E70 TaxID=2853439 RepID=UPI00211BBD1C|nr:hypothetical protein [Sphingobacterium sp. E70]ULT23563.1 hypothetical protein KUH03_30990 [Sphingobacterium sp. E70]